MRQLTPIILALCCNFPHLAKSESYASTKPSDDLNPALILQKSECRDEHKQDCLQLLEVIGDHWLALQFHKHDYNGYDAQLLRLDLNEAIESFQSLARSMDRRQDDKYIGSQDAIKNKYQYLRELLANQPRIAYAPDLDSPRSSDVYNISYHHLEYEAVQKVNEAFGQLELSPDMVSSLDQPVTYTYEAPIPWAGYWYPNYDPVLHHGEESITAKFDRIMARLGKESKAQDFEQRLLGIQPDSWEGLCNAWSVASIMTKEPSQAIEFEGEILEITDQKALLTKIYENYPVDIYGIRYTGDHLTDGTYQDLRPEAFHRLVEAIIGERNQPLIFDEDAGIEVWQKPFYRVDWAFSADSHLEYAFVFTARAWKVEPRWEKSNEMTSRRDYGYNDYQYRLYVDPHLYETTGRLLVIAGEWLNDSIKHHPDYAIVPHSDARARSFNPSLDDNIDTIKKILGIR